jgi:hypothetical protein
MHNQKNILLVYCPFIGTAFHSGSLNKQKSNFLNTETRTFCGHGGGSVGVGGGGGVWEDSVFGM